MIMLESTSTISNGSSFQGDFSTSGKLIIAGKLSGSILVNGTLVLTHSGTCTGDIEAKIIIVDGVIEGNIYAEESLVLKADSKVNGSIVTPSLTIHIGACVTGNVRIGKSPKLTVICNENMLTETPATPEERRLLTHG